MEPHTSPSLDPSNEDPIVISGISVRLPESSNIEEFGWNLYNGIDLITEDARRGPPGLYGLPKRNGKLKELDKFDATFFGVHAKQAHVMDPQIRILLELTFEAIMDSGYNPETIRGSRTGVFVGVSISDSEEAWTRDPDAINGYALLGCTRSMFANRISYTFDFNGPSFALDAACASGLLGIEQAVSSIRSGRCDSAIVGGCSLLLKQKSSLHPYRLGMLSMDGRCKTFDVTADGYARSEAIVVVFIQKQSVARRAYARILHAKTNVGGYKDHGITFAAGDVQRKLFEEVYKEAGINPAHVDYVEAHGTGTKVGDPQELNAIADIFCTPDRPKHKPLLVGAVKSNMGHSEAASGLCNIAKVIWALQNGVIPQNLNFNNPNPAIPALVEGKIKVISENTPFNFSQETIIGVNSFGFGGANVHIILKPSPKNALNSKDASSLKAPILLPLSGRTEEGLQNVLNQINSKSWKITPELAALIYEIIENDIPGHRVRGYTLANQAVSDVGIQISTTKPQIWYIFSGMGSQWSEMGKHLMEFEIYGRSIQKSAQIVLKAHNFDLMAALMGTNKKDEDLEDVLKAFVSITSIQIALVDLLDSIGLSPDGLIGHSIGELGCAYADRCFTHEQTILAAYARGRAILDSHLPPGAMASIGLSWKEAFDRCPRGLIFPACHNSLDNVSVSGQPIAIREFVAMLQAEGIFAREINSSGQAFHSKYIEPAGMLLEEALEKLVPVPLPRTPRWVSTSTNLLALGKFSSPAYHVNNLLSPVLFQEALEKIPPNSIVIEISPHALLQSILKRSLSSGVMTIGLMNRNAKNNSIHFLNALGKIWIAGINLKFRNLYPEIAMVEYPVPLGTPYLSTLVTWDHSVSWDVAKFGPDEDRLGNNLVEVSLSNEEDSFLTGHRIDGRALYPATGHLYNVWQIYVKLHGSKYDQFGIVFENIKFERATILAENSVTKFLINILEGCGEFEVIENNEVVVTGKIRQLGRNEFTSLVSIAPESNPDTTETLSLNSIEVYRTLRLRGYEYAGIFRGIQEADIDGNWLKLKWENNWISFLYTMLQSVILTHPYAGLYLPVGLEKLIIDPEAFLNAADGGKVIPIEKYQHLEIVSCPGIQLAGLKTSLVRQGNFGQNEPILEQFKFIPYFDEDNLKSSELLSYENALRVLVKIVIENSLASKLKVIEIVEDLKNSVGQLVHEFIMEEPLVQDDITILTPCLDAIPVENSPVKIIRSNSVTLESQPNFFILENPRLVSNVEKSMKENSFLLVPKRIEIPANLILIANKTCETNKELFLYRKPEQHYNARKILSVNVTHNNYNWIETVQEIMNLASTAPAGTAPKLFLFAESEVHSGLLGLINCLKQEPGGHALRILLIQDMKTEFDLIFQSPSPLLQKILDADLITNVINENGTWGTFSHLPLKPLETSQLKYAFLNNTKLGNVSNLNWVENDLKYCPDKDKLCSVAFAGVNSRDVLLASGKLSPNSLPKNHAKLQSLLGIEYSGTIDSNGKQIMGIVPGGAFSTKVLPDPILTWELPSHWSLEDGSTVPLSYATAYYALIVTARIAPNEKLLICSGINELSFAIAGARVALSMSCEVYVSVRSEKEKELLQETLPEKLVFFTQSTLESKVIQITKGLGVDVILIASPNPRLDSRCLASNGRYVVISEYGQESAMAISRGSLHYVQLADVTNEEDKTSIFKLVCEGIKSGVVQPLPKMSYLYDKFQQAFQLQRTHDQKMLLEIPHLVNGQGRTYFSPEKVVIILGGLGGFGLELAGWLIGRGVKKLVLVSRSGVTTGYQEAALRKWKEEEIVVLTPTKIDTSNSAGATELITFVQKTLGIIGGIFNCAMVLKDGFMKNLTKQNFIDVGKSKIDTTISLDKASRDLCPELEYFVAFSSVSCGRGWPGQSNYGWANSIMERICERRQKDGFPGLAIQWGSIGDVGVVADAEVVNNTIPQKINSCMETLDRFLQLKNVPTVASTIVAPHGFGSKKKDANNKNGNLTVYQTVARILGMKEISKANSVVNLGELGMDSLMGIEIKQSLEREFGISLSLQEIHQINFDKLKEMDEEIKQRTPSNS